MNQSILDYIEPIQWLHEGTLEINFGTEADPHWRRGSFVNTNYDRCSYRKAPPKVREWFVADFGDNADMGQLRLTHDSAEAQGIKMGGKFKVIKLREVEC